MLEVYLVALAVGGTLLAVTLLFGGDHGDVEAEVEADVGTDGGVDLADAALAWLPVTSVRFWIFGLAFFGLTGLVLDRGGLLAAVPAAIAAAGVGYVAGVTVTRVLRRLGRDHADSALGEGDCVGEIATVVLPIAPGTTGKVRLSIKGRVVELLADSEEEHIDRRESVVVYGVNEEGRALVARSNRLTDRAEG